MIKIDDFTNKVLNSYSKEITDQVFLYIQNDRELMHEYLTLINSNDIRYVNSQIAKAIKERYGLTPLENKGVPKSSLIQSFEEFK
jgi:hypothetical protein